MKKPAILARLKQRFGASGPGLTVAVIAMIVALAGTAYAATKLNGTQKKEVEKIAKKYAGKPGATGAQGLAGGQGPAGPKGDTGAKGDKGDQGNQGLPGSNGKSPEIVADSDELCGPTTPGVGYEVEGSGEEAQICNGKEGSPWTATGTLPPGATETGGWSTGMGTGKAPAILSFSLPLVQKIIAPNIHIKGGPADPLCTGNTTKPAAAPGVLCIYKGEFSEASEPIITALDGTRFEDETTFEEVNTTSFAGAILWWNLANGFATGSYAVTGCNPVPTEPFPCP